jgi:pimeloyl-ACP methyl ester carboxylesterase
MELLELGGRKIAYRRAGGGHPLVLLHGAWSDGREWRPQLAGLPDEFDVIAWDARTTSARSLDTARSPPPCATCTPTRSRSPRPATCCPRT